VRTLLDEIDRQECLRLAVQLLKLRHHDPDLYRTTVSMLHALCDRMEEGQLLKAPRRYGSGKTKPADDAGDAS